VGRRLRLLPEAPDAGEPPDQPLPGGSIVLVAAGRSDVAALAPVAVALSARLPPGAQVVLEAGQRTNLSAVQTHPRLDSALPVSQLEVAAGSRGVETATALSSSERLLAEAEPSVLVVSGASDASLGCALAATKLGVPVARLDAGLRRHDWRAPDEVNRVLMDTLADTLFAPTADAAANLVAEGLPESRIYETGSTVVDAARQWAPVAQSLRAYSQAKLKAGGYALVSLGRAENLERDERLARIVEALALLARRTAVAMSIDRRIGHRLRSMGDDRRLAQAGVRMLPPVDYPDFLSLVAAAQMVITDSGALQDEASAYGVPCFTLGMSTERTTTLTLGTNTLVGADPPDLEQLDVRAMTKPAQLFAAAHAGAGERIADVLVANYTLVRASLS
jgi:UDP-N-acetylglucosamine 2-epimerase (non-hydrolysing)